MRYARGPTDSIDGSDHVLAPAFACSWRQGGLDAGSVDVTGELDIATTPHLERMLIDRMLALTGSFQDVEISDADPLRRLVEARPVS
jgi:hypothetical protein